MYDFGKSEENLDLSRIYLAVMMFVITSNFVYFVGIPYQMNLCMIFMFFNGFKKENAK